jgi:hypothetical protein
LSFPEIKFGICQVCGEAAGDQVSGLTTADAPARDIVGSGVLLEDYDGKMTCKQCIQRLKADEESLVSAEKHAEEERFRNQSGFVNSV